MKRLAEGAYASKKVRLNLETEVKRNSVRCWIEVSTSWGVSPYIILFRDKHMYVRTSTDSHLYVHYERLEVAIQTSPPTNGRQASFIAHVPPGPAVANVGTLSSSDSSGTFGIYR